MRQAHMRRVLDEDLRGYHERWHHDIDDLAGTYLDRPGWALLVAELDDAFAGTTIVKPGGPASPPTPPWLARRYATQHTGQLSRVWIVRELRRRGVGRALVTAAARWALGPCGYEVVCLHTDASSPGALEFWRSYPAAVEVFDARPDPWDTIHFDLDAARLPDLDAARLPDLDPARLPASSMPSDCLDEPMIQSILRRFPRTPGQMGGDARMSSSISCGCTGS